MAAADRGSFSSAARDLFVTPQTISKSIGELEQELGASLFQREGRGVALTDCGARLSPHVAKALCCIAEMRALSYGPAAAEGDEGSLSLFVAHSASRGNALTCEDLIDFQTVQPHIRLSAEHRTSNACITSLRRRLVDAIVMPGRIADPAVVSAQIFSCRVSVACASGHPLAGRAHVSLEDLEITPIAAPEEGDSMRSTLTSSFSTRALHPVFVPVAPAAETLGDFLTSCGGTALVIDDPRLDALLPGITRIPLELCELSRVPICMSYARDSTNPSLQRMKDFLVWQARSHRIETCRAGAA